MSLYPQPDGSDGALRSRFVLHGLVCLALALAFFLTRTPEALAPLRLRETRLGFLLHLACNAAFLYALWLRTRQPRTLGFRPALVLILGWLCYLSLSAARSPLRGAALETWAFWLDAVLLSSVALTALSRAPEFFLLLLAGTAGLLTLAGLTEWAKAGPSPAPHEFFLVLGVALIGAATLYFGRTDRLFRERRFARLGALLLGLILLPVLDRLIQRKPADAPEQVAAQAIVIQNPVSGYGLGTLPEVLTAYAPGDFPSLPLPRDSCLGLRAELGWIGAAFLGFVALAALLSMFRIVRLFPLTPRAFTGFGLAGLLVYIALDACGRPVLLHPFGQLILFTVIGLLMGVEHTAPAAPAPRAPIAPGNPPPFDWRDVLRPRPWREFAQLSTWAALPWRSIWQSVSRRANVLFLIAAAVISWITIQESRPWRAAGLALPRGEERLYSDSYGKRLARAAAMYPHEATHWDLLAAHYREVLNRWLFNEGRLQRVVKTYDRAIQVNSYCFKRYLSLGLVYYRAKRLTEAIVSFRRGLQFQPQSEALRLWLVKACIEARNFREAVEELKVLAHNVPPQLAPQKPGDPARINPDWIKIDFRLAEAYEALGEPARALDHYAIAYQKNPTGPFHEEALAGMERLKAKFLADQAAKEKK